VALLARAQRFIGQGNLQLVVSGAVGGGDGFRLTVAHNKDAGVPRNDSVRGGPLVIGPGIGPIFHITKHVALTAEVRALAGLPDPALLLDGWAGVQVGF
jgi:hypothetical protein